MIATDAPSECPQMKTDSAADVHAGSAVVASLEKRVVVFHTHRVFPPVHLTRVGPTPNQINRRAVLRRPLFLTELFQY